MNDLTVSNIERQNVLNNRYALQTIQENLDVKGLRFHDQLLFTTEWWLISIEWTRGPLSVMFRNMEMNFGQTAIF